MALNIERVRRAVRGVSGIELSSNTLSAAIFAADLVGPIIMPFDVNASESRAEDITVILRGRLGLGKADRNRVEIHLLGESALWAGLNETSKRELATAETIGFPILLIVLLMIFGSLTAAMLPIILGAVAVTVTGALIYFLSLMVQLSVFITDTASMLGIGVAVDYSLFILARVRQELQAGLTLADARKAALATSGRVVTFSGLTVIASLLGVWVIPNGTLRSMALGAIVVVAMSVIASVTLLPALIEIIGARRISSSRLTTRVRGGRRKRQYLSWDRWTRTVMRRPILSITIVTGLLLALSIPTLSMLTSTGALQQLTPTNETRIGFSEAAKLVGPGSLGPTNVIVHASSSSSQAEFQRWVTVSRRTADRLPHIQQLGPTHYSRDGSDALFTVTPSVDPESPVASQVVDHLRIALPAAVRGSGVSVAIGGTSASILDEEREIAGSIWKLIFAVLVLAFLILTVVLRSLLLPIKAIAMNLLSVGAAYGVLVIVFQWGWFDSVFSYRSPGHVDTLIPPLIFAIVFGLSMDYEVFLLSRIRERWLATGDSRGAVAEGLSASAKTVSSAALVLVCVFAVFIGTGLPSVKEIGLGAAVAIGLDATLIRLILVPATMELLGRWNWWLPRPLNRLIPAPIPVVATGTTTSDMPTLSTIDIR